MALRSLSYLVLDSDYHVPVVVLWTDQERGRDGMTSLSPMDALWLAATLTDAVAALTNRAELPALKDEETN